MADQSIELPSGSKVVGFLPRSASYWIGIAEIRTEQEDGSAGFALSDGVLLKHKDPGGVKGWCKDIFVMAKIVEDQPVKERERYDAEKDLRDEVHGRISRRSNFLDLE